MTRCLARKHARKTLRGRAQVGLAHDVVAVEHRSRLVAADLHGRALADARPHEVARAAAP